jgi:hypothetical protein
MGPSVRREMSGMISVFARPNESGKLKEISPEEEFKTLNGGSRAVAQGLLAMRFAHIARSSTSIQMAKLSEFDRHSHDSWAWNSRAPECCAFTVAVSAAVVVKPYPAATVTRPMPSEGFAG